MYVEKVKAYLETPKERPPVVGTAMVAAQSLTRAASELDSLPDLLSLIAERLKPASNVAIEHKLTLSLADAASLSDCPVMTNTPLNRLPDR